MTFFVRSLRVNIFILISTNAVIVEVVYKDVVYNGLGEIKENPVNVLVREAFPNKTFRVSEIKPSGLRGYLRMFLPPYTSTSMYRREQQILVLIGATGNLFIFG